MWGVIIAVLSAIGVDSRLYLAVFFRRIYFKTVEDVGAARNPQRQHASQALVREAWDRAFQQDGVVFDAAKIDEATRVPDL
jgi:hypothetical protein